MYKNLIRPILFCFDAESIHYFVNYILKISFQIPIIADFLKKAFIYEHPSLEREVFGIKFKNPVGLAAGFDKNADLVDELSYLGFGFIEIGTVTPLPQAGNEKPRLFRLNDDKALINRMGFNNKGVEVAANKLRNRKSKLIIGGNIGKNKLTPNENALDDYLKCFDTLYNTVDYFVVNVSSPNTPGLRDLQEKEPLTKILSTLEQRNQQLAHAKPTKPILLKVAPDLTDNQLDDIVDIVLNTKIAGVIATNTTIGREGLKTNHNTIENIGAGGLSGKPLKNRATEVIKYLAKKSNYAFPIIAVGGIFSAQDALEKLQAGASLVQVYTGFIYEGPTMIKEICKKLVENKI